jgi:hypothetical protein
MMFIIKKGFNCLRDDYLLNNRILSSYFLFSNVHFPKQRFVIVSNA